MKTKTKKMNLIQLQQESTRNKLYQVFAYSCITGATAIAILDLTLTASIAQQRRYTCELHGFKTPCDVWRDGNRISIGGFQAAPVFTLHSPWKAVDHRGFIYKVMKGDGYVFFNPAGEMEGTAVKVYGLTP